jgi:hypothetical protein
MQVDQEWGAVWPGPRSFQPATVPLPVRQGYPRKAAAPPGKFVNAELMKIPNFLHLTPPVIKKQCKSYVVTSSRQFLFIFTSIFFFSRRSIETILHTLAKGT